MSFHDPILGGSVLLRPAIQSPNYKAGTAGWTINQDGTAEFSQLAIYSVAGTGERVVVTNGQISIYSPTGQLLTTLDGSSGITNYWDTKFAQLSQGVLYLADRTYYPISANINVGPNGLELLGPRSIAGSTAASIDIKPGGNGIGSVSVTGNLSTTGNLDVTGNLNVVGNLSAPNLQRGSATITTTAGTWTSVNVTFPQPFSTVPTVTAMGQNFGPGLGSTTTLQYSVSSVTTTGFVLFVMRTNVVTMTVGWIALA